MHLSTCSVKHPLSKSRFDRETPVTQILQSENFKLGRVDKRIRNLFPYRWRRRWNLTILPGEEEIKFLESSKEIVNKFFYSLIAYQEYGKKHKKLFGPGARPGHLKKFRPSHAPPRVRTGHPTNSTQWRFTLPCGQGLHSTQLLFSFPCEHRFAPIASRVPRYRGDSKSGRVRLSHRRYDSPRLCRKPPRWSRKEHDRTTRAHEVCI